MSEYYQCAKCGEASSIRYSPIAIRADLKERLELIGWAIGPIVDFIGEIRCPDCVIAEDFKAWKEKTA